MKWKYFQCEQLIQNTNFIHGRVFSIFSMNGVKIDADYIPIQNDDPSFQ